MTTTSSVLSKHTVTALKDVSVLLANSDSVNGRAKTVYYKSILIILGSIVEAYLYDLVCKRCAADPTLFIKKTVELKSKTKISKVAFGGPKQYHIAEEIINYRTMKDVTASFKSMNNFCREKALVSESLYKELEHVRKLRNTVHLQTLASHKRSYTKPMLVKITLTMFSIYVVSQK